MQMDCQLFRWTFWCFILVMANGAFSCSHQVWLTGFPHQDVCNLIFLTNGASSDIFSQNTSYFVASGALTDAKSQWHTVVFKINKILKNKLKVNKH